MVFLDIHSHILPCVDDGAKSIEVSIGILEMLKKQGVTDVIATPHFYAYNDDFEDFFEHINSSYNELLEAIKDMDLPKVHLGCELLYFPQMGKSNGVKHFTLCGSNYMLLELPNGKLDGNVFDDIYRLINNYDIIPIFAHLERYSKAHGFRDILGFIEQGNALAQVNTSSVIGGPFKRITHKLIKKNYVSFLGSDAHSLRARPPMFDEALKVITNKFGEKRAKGFIKNSNKLYENIIGTNDEK